MPKARARKAVAVVDAAPVAMDESTALISMIERAARDPSVDIDKMERLFQMQERAQAQRAKTAFLAAFADLQAELPAAPRGGVGHNQKKYARFEDVIEALRPYLHKHGFSLSHRVNTEGNTIRVTGVLGHRAGHTEQTEMTLPPDASGGKTPVHAMASAISYGKRYVTLTLTGIATEDDDDGKAAGAGATVSEEQSMAIIDMLDATGSDRAQFCRYFKVATVNDLPAKDFDRAISALKRKAAANG